MNEKKLWIQSSVERITLKRLRPMLNTLLALHREGQGLGWMTLTDDCHTGSKLGVHPFTFG